jgi:hypothetical protein
MTFQRPHHEVHGFRDDKPNEFVSTCRDKRGHPDISGHVGLGAELTVSNVERGQRGAGRLAIAQMK